MTSRKASDIYKKQNILIHKAFGALGMPYQKDSTVWLKLMTDIVKRSVGGLSELTLGERHRLIVHFQKQGIRLFAPAVPKDIRNWKKGDDDIEHEFREEDNRQVRMVLAMWEDMGYKRKTLYGLCIKLFGQTHPRWLDESQLSHLVNVVKKKAESKGAGAYYRRRGESCT